MTNKQMSLIASAVAIALALSACGGGGGGSSTGTATTSSTTVGTVTGFGSVFVNGVEFETDTSTVSMDDANGDDSNLRVGMVVTVQGSIDNGGTTGVATSVEYDDELEGVVVSNNIAPGGTTGTLDIMGQTVTVTATTVFDSDVAGVTSVDLIAAGNVVEVSGFADGAGNVEATRIEVKATDLSTYLASHDAIETKGVVSGLDTGAFTFQLGGLTVDYSGAVIDDMPAGGLADGLYVEVKSIAGIDSGTGNLIASRVELEDDGDFGHEGEDGEEMDIEGTITRDFNGTSFQINGTDVLVTDATELENIAAAGLLAGTQVKVEGEFNANGELVASSIEAEDDHEDDANEIQGTVASVTLEGANTGTIELSDGTVIHVTNDTIMEDDRDQGYIPDEQFNLTDIGNSNRIEARVYTDTAGDLIAIKIEREDS